MSMLSFITILSLYYALILNFPVIAKIYQVSTSSSLIFPYISPLLLTFVFMIVFSFLAVPYLFKPLFIVLTLSSALAFYATLKYSVMFDYGMMENLLATNAGEAGSYINFSSVLYFIIFGVLPSLLILNVKIVTSGSLVKALVKRILYVIFAIAGIIVIGLLFYKDYASVGRNNHYLNKMINPAHVYNLVKYINSNYLQAPLVYKVLGEDAQLESSLSGKPTLMILVVGETARSQNSFYNGYPRNTDPYTQKMGLISLQNVSSCGTATAHSLPCMFSRLNRNNYSKAQANSQDNVLDVLAHAGVNLLWMDNDGGDKSVAKHLHKIEINPHENAQLCDGSSCYDQVLIDKLDRNIKMDKGNKLIVLHIMGSHGPTYWKRYPESKAAFQPACNQSDIENCSDQEIVNVYDNTLVYTDYIIAQSIEKLKKHADQYDVALMYLSDHGESLGENGLYLHGTPYAIAPKEQTSVPWLIWLPEDYAYSKGIDKVCLMGRAKHGHFSHDNLFDTLLGLYGVKTAVKDKSLNILASCKVT